MILGYVDSDDRIYDLGFATMRLRVRIEAGEGGASRVAFSQVAGSGAASYRVLGEADARAEVSMDHDGHRIPLLREVEGHLFRHEAGLLFFASPATRDPADPGYFLVKLRAMPARSRSSSRTNRAASSSRSRRTRCCGSRTRGTDSRS